MSGPAKRGAGEIHGINPHRVAEVYVSSATGQSSAILHSRGEFGTAYLVTTRQLVTSAHVVARATAGACDVRLLGTDVWVSAAIKWCDNGLDVALLELERPPERVPGDTPVWGRLGPERIECEALGFPELQADREYGRDTEHFIGRILPYSGLKRGIINAELAGSPVRRDDWRGMSGSALFALGNLVGIVCEVMENGARLLAVPVSRLAESPSFQTVFEDGQALSLVSVGRGRAAAIFGDMRGNTSPELKALYRERADLLVEGRDTAAVDGRIAEAKRRLRRGRELNPGDVLAGRYELVRWIGQGGFATVWQAYDEKRQRHVALKVLHAQHAHDQSRRERFFRGAQRMAELEHEGITKVFERQGHDGEFHYFSMEYIPGGNLEQRVLGGQLSPDGILEITRRVGEALAHAHSRGMVHRDVKPANVLLDRSGAPKLVDFDLCRPAIPPG